MIRLLRNVIVTNLPAGYVERFDGGMLSYEIPLEVYPDTHNRKPLQLAALAPRKNHISLYLMAVYANKSTAAWFTRAFAASGHKLRMGKSCVRFGKVADVPTHVIAQAIARVPAKQYIRFYEASASENSCRRMMRAPLAYGPRWHPAPPSPWVSCEDRFPSSQRCWMLDLLRTGSGWWSGALGQITTIRPRSLLRPSLLAFAVAAGIALAATFLIHDGRLATLRAQVADPVGLRRPFRFGLDRVPDLVIRACLPRHR